MIKLLTIILINLCYFILAYTSISNDNEKNSKNKILELIIIILKFLLNLFN